MKKIKNFLMLFIFFLIFSNINYATESGTYTASRTGSGSKLLFFLIGFMLVSLVLFIGYKLDKMEEDQKRKSRYKNQGYPNEIEDIYSSIFSSKSTNNYSSFNYALNNIEEQEIDEEENNENDYDIELKDIDDSLIKELMQSETQEAEENIKEYNSESADSNDKVIEAAEETEDLEKAERKIENPELDNISAMFDTKVFDEGKTENEVNIGVKGYDFNGDEDWDLLEIQNTIKAANIKRYTRKKEPIVQEAHEVKRYTRKKEKKQEVVEVKRYTRKKQEKTQKDILEEIDKLEIEEKPKAKRGRKPKVKTEENATEKAKEEIPKSKRGRKPKSETTEEKPKAKRGRKPKAESVETSTPKKRGRKPKVKEEDINTINIENLPKSRRGRKPKAK